MRNLGYNIIYLIQLIRFFGLKDGVYIFFKIIANTTIIRIKPGKFNNTVTIRKKDSDLPIFYQIFAELQYDITFFIPFKPARIIDCGANVGYASLYFATIFPEAEIIAIEPEINNYNSLKANTLNYKQIKPVNAGVWYEQTEISIKNEIEMSASFEVTNAGGLSGKIIKAVTINDIMSDYNFEQTDILKIDIEGAEFDLFNNNPHEWLAKTRCLIIELHDNLKRGTSTIFFKEMSKYNWKTYIRGENIICFRDYD